MAAKIILTARQNSFKFSDRVLCLDHPVPIGRTGGQTKSDSENAYFDCKVLSKSHALLLYKDSKIFLLDTGSSNGTFVNNIRLSKAGKESEPTEVFTGDIIRLGTEVLDKNKKVKQLPVVATLKIFLKDGIETYQRSPSSLLFRPSESEEDVTVVDDDDGDDQSSLSLSSMMLLKEKLLEMQQGMEFLSVKERDYEDLQILAEEEAETICELEKENYKLTHALNNIETKIAHEKEKYMKLAEYEAETICNLEKENYKLTDTLNNSEETFQKERGKYKTILESSKREKEMLDIKLTAVFAEMNKKNDELEEVKSQLIEAKHNVFNLEKENAALLANQDLQLSEATEADYHELVKAELNNLTESRRQSQTNIENLINKEGADLENIPSGQQEPNTLKHLKIEPTRHDMTIVVVIAWISFMVGFLFDDFSF